MLENASQTIAYYFDASQGLWDTPSQLCTIAACGWALIGTMYRDMDEDSKSGVIHPTSVLVNTSGTVHRLFRKGYSVGTTDGFLRVFPSIKNYNNVVLIIFV